MINKHAKINLEQPKKPWNFPHVSLKLYASFLSFIFFKNKYKSIVSQPFENKPGNHTQKKHFILWTLIWGLDKYLGINLI